MWERRTDTSMMPWLAASPRSKGGRGVWISKKKNLPGGTGCASTARRNTD